LRKRWGKKKKRKKSNRGRSGLFRFETSQAGHQTKARLETIDLTVINCTGGQIISKQLIQRPNKTVDTIPIQPGHDSGGGYQTGDHEPGRPSPFKTVNGGAKDHMKGSQFPQSTHWGGPGRPDPLPQKGKKRKGKKPGSAGQTPQKGKKRKEKSAAARSPLRNISQGEHWEKVVSAKKVGRFCSPAQDWKHAEWNRPHFFFFFFF